MDVFLFLAGSVQPPECDKLKQVIFELQQLRVIIKSIER